MSVYRRPLRSDELIHHGVKGQKWGVKNGPPYPLHPESNLSLKDAKTQNIDKWGSDARHNTLYISGKSGSGKSTLARNIADENTNIIHLDMYTEIGGDKDYRDQEFESWLKLNGYDTKRLTTGKGTKQWGKSLDDFQDQMESFAANQYKNGKKVIVEGVQLMDDTFYPDKSFFNDKPTAVMKTSDRVAANRARRRDARQ